MSAITDSTSDLPAKQCPKCGIVYLHPQFHFQANTKNRDGLHSYCKKCIAVYQQHYRAAKKEEISLHRKQYRVQNAELVAAQKRAYYLRNKNKVIAAAQRYYINNRQKVLERARINGRAYYKTHPDVWRASTLRYQARKRALPAKYSSDDWQRTLEYFGYCCVYCGDQQGLWNPMSADHFIPLSSPECPGTVPTNMLPACQSCNSSKNNSTPQQWVVWKFGARKAKKILARIEAYFASLEVE